MHSIEASEEEEWPDSSHMRQLTELDRAAQCSICHAVYNTPLSLLCGHSFCADCLRSNIQYQEQSSGKVVCPQCRQPADSRQVVANHQLRELVKAYSVARGHLIRTLRGHLAGAIDESTNKQLRPYKKRGAEKPARARRKRCKTEGHEVITLESSPEQEVITRELRKPVKEVQYFPKQLPGLFSGEETEECSASEEEAGMKAEQEDRISASEASTSSFGSGRPLSRRRSSGEVQQPAKDQKKPPPRNWAECPCCTQHFPLAFFNDHLDKCLDSGGKPGGVIEAERPRQLQVPPKLLLAIEKDKSLRDRLKKYGLSSKGSRQELQQRYNRFRVEVQTAVDKAEAAATYASLARRVMSRESNETHASSNGLAMRSSRAKQGLEVATSSFEELIKATRERAGAEDLPDPGLLGIRNEDPSGKADETQGDAENAAAEEAAVPAAASDRQDAAHSGQLRRRFGRQAGSGSDLAQQVLSETVS